MALPRGSLNLSKVNTAAGNPQTICALVKNEPKEQLVALEWPQRKLKDKLMRIFRIICVADPKIAKGKTNLQ